MIQPVGNNILVKPLAPPEFTDGGLLIPENARAASNKCVVFAFGAKVNGLKKGDVVFRVKDWGQEIVDNGETYFLMDAKNVIAKQ